MTVFDTACIHSPNCCLKKKTNIQHILIAQNRDLFLSLQKKCCRDIVPEKNNTLQGQCPEKKKKKSVVRTLQLNNLLILKFECVKLHTSLFLHQKIAMRKNAAHVRPFVYILISSTTCGLLFQTFRCNALFDFVCLFKQKQTHFSLHDLYSGSTIVTWNFQNK